MLTIAKMGRSRAFYYADLAQDQAELDRNEVGEKPGQWLGQGAAWMGLSGTVDREDFIALFHGFAPGEDGYKLVQSAGRANHCPGWDCTFPAPKSFSAIWAIAPPDMQAQLEAIQFEAAKAAISYLENHAQVRRGQGGKETEPAWLIVAAFEHCTNRNLEPCLHHHALVLNSGIGEEASLALDSSFLYKNKMAAGAIYRAELASRLEQQLGIAVQREQRWFEIKGFSRHSGPYQALMNQWSSRRLEIEALEPKTPAQAQAAAYMTRAPKETHLSREELMTKWREVAAAHGLTAEKVQALAHGPQQRSLLNRKWQEWCAVRQARVELVKHQSHFSRREVVRAVAEAAQGRGLSGKDVLRLTDKYLASRQVMKLQVTNGEQRYTTKHLHALELSLLKEVDCLSRMRSAKVSEKPIGAAIARRSLSEEQAQALRDLCDRRSLQVLSGLSGTGKTQVLGAVADVYRQNGHHILGVTLSREGVASLMQKTGIGKLVEGDTRPRRPDEEQSLTLARLLTEVERARSQETDSLLSRRTVVVVDDAQTLSVAQMKRLTEAVRSAGAKLILSGNPKGIQSYEQDGAFQGVIQRLHERSLATVELTTFHRQIHDHDRDVVQNLSQGNALTALTALAQRGQLTLATTRTEGIQALVSTWASQAGRYPKGHLLITDSQEETRLVNRQAQLAMKEAGHLERRAVRVNNIELHVGDRIRFTHSDRLQGITKGDMGSVTKVGLLTRSVTVKLDSGMSRVIYPGSTPGIDLGYAVTVRQAQNLETQYAYALTKGLGREYTLTHLSRSQAGTHLVCYDVAPSSPLWEVARRVQYERTVELAVQVREREQRR